MEEVAEAGVGCGGEPEFNSCLRAINGYEASSRDKVRGRMSETCMKNGAVGGGWDNGCGGGGWATEPRKTTTHVD